MTKQFWTGLVIGILASGVVGGIVGASMVGKKATVAPADMETYFVNQLKNLKIPKVPLPEAPPTITDEYLAQGGEHFNHHCAVCHDLGGDADSALAKAFYPPVADLTSDHVQKYSDGQLKWIVENGIRFTGMPGWEDIIDETTQWNIVNYMRVLANPEKSEQLKGMLEEKGKWKSEAPSGHAHPDPTGEAGESTNHHKEPQEHQSDSHSDNGETPPPVGHEEEHQH